MREGKSINISTVLLIDDDPTTLFYNEYVLKEVDPSCQVWTAQNGQDALEKLDEIPEEDEQGMLILLDINMPVMNGFEFADQYQKRNFHKNGNWHLLMLTTSEHDRDHQRAKTLPAIQQVLVKPLSVDVIQHYFSSSDREHLSRQNLESLAGNDFGFVKEMIHLSKSEFEKNSSVLEEAVNTLNFEDLSAITHKFKNGLRIFKAEEALVHLEELSSKSASHEPQGIRSSYDLFVPALEKVMISLAAWEKELA